MKSSYNIFKKTALATVIAGTLGVAAIPAAQANVVVVSFKGAFTMLNSGGSALQNQPSTYQNGFYSNAPVGTGSATNGPATTYGWLGMRTPITGTMSFDTTTGAGVATVTPFMFFGKKNANFAEPLGISFQSIDSVGTLVGGMLFSWNKGVHSVSIVMNAGQMFAGLPGLIGGGPTGTLSGVADAVSNTATGMTPAGAMHNVLVGTSTLNTATGCNGLTLATQVNAYTINTNFANLGTCTNTANGFGTNDGIGGSPMTSPSFTGFNGNFDISQVHLNSYTPTPVPVPAAVWLFGSGLLGLVGIARRKKKA